MDRVHVYAHGSLCEQLLREYAEQNRIGEWFGGTDGGHTAEAHGRVRIDTQEVSLVLHIGTDGPGVHLQDSNGNSVQYVPQGLVQDRVVLQIGKGMADLLSGSFVEGPLRKFVKDHPELGNARKVALPDVFEFPATV